MADPFPQDPARNADFGRDIVAIAARGDRAAFSRLFDAYAPRVKSYLLRNGMDSAGADELTQDIMLQVWRRAETFDPDQATASTWIFTIARNRRIDAFRRERHPEIAPDDPALAPEALPMADQALGAIEEAARLRAALADLPPEQADLVRRAYYEDKPHSVLAAEVGLPLGTVKSRLRLALARLRRDLAEAHG